MTEADRQIRLMSLSKGNWIALFAIFFVTLLFSLGITASIFLDALKFDTADKRAISVLISTSLSGVSVYYARKLYKSGINSSYKTSEEVYTVAQLSTIAYFIFRIPMGIVFSLISYSLWRLSLVTSIPMDTEVSESILYSATVIGFFSGFSAGRLLTSFDEKGSVYVGTASRNS